MIEKIGDINLSSEHWDCECEQSYIHSMPEKSCPACGAEQEESPNSRADEVVKNRLTMEKRYDIKNACSKETN